MKTKVLFLGRKPVAAKCLDYLLGRDDVDIQGVLTDSHLSVSPTSEVARENNLRLYTFDEALNDLAAGKLCFDLGFSVLYWRRLKEGFLSIPERGIINFHPAPLPEYKGTAGYNMAVLDELSEWGVSAHYVDESIDTGDIIEVDTFGICDKTETAKSIEKSCQNVLFEQFLRVSDAALNSPITLPVKSNVGGRYISRNEMESMKQVMPGDDVERKIRAFWFPPYDGAYIMINGVKCTLVDRAILNQLADQDSSSLFTSKMAV